MKSNSTKKDQKSEAQAANEPSLYEQLFPDWEDEAQKQREREVPRLPLEAGVQPPTPPFTVTERDLDSRTHSARNLERRMEEQDPDTSVLVLRNASKNLVEEDFRRLIPQGKHMEGWTLEQGDILRVIPGRDHATLEQCNWYYLLFSSPLSAFTYQGHATRVHQIAAAHTPSSMLSPMMPPPGYMVQDMDVSAAIESYTLTPPNQRIDLRQLKPPLSPVMATIVQHGGYKALLTRKDRMPHEARLTLEGPQLHHSAIRHILYLSGKARGLSWSGNDDPAPKLTKWEPRKQAEKIPSTLDKGGSTQVRARKQEDVDEGVKGWDGLEANEQNGGPQNPSTEGELKRRTPPSVYVVGFQTQRALQSFVHFWHRRPMDWEGFDRAGDEGDLAPIANVGVLW